MKCANHPGSDAIGLCTGCQRALCSECQTDNDTVLCSRCVIAHNNAVTRYFFKQLAISGLLLAGSLSILSNSPVAWQTATLLALMASFLPFGWSALTRYFPPGHHYFHPAARFMALSFHLFVAALLGWLVGPWQIYKAVREIMKARSANLSFDQQ
jgi:hypothetical protein